MVVALPQQTGLGHLLYLGGTDLSGDTASAEISCPAVTQPVTNVTQTAVSRIITTQDGQISWATWFNPAGEHPVLKALPLADVVTTYVCGADAVASAAGVLARQPDYKAVRGADGSLSFAVQALSDGSGLEWGHGYVGGPIRTDTAATNGTGVDDGSSSSGGFTGYLHVFSIANATAIISMQHSNDNGATDPWVTFLTFTAVSSAPTAQRVAVTGSVKRWVRVVTTGF